MSLDIPHSGVTWPVQPVQWDMGDHWAQSLDLGAIDLLQRTSDTIVPLVSGTFDHQGVKAETVAKAPTHQPVPDAKNTAKPALIGFLELPIDTCGRYLNVRHDPPALRRFPRCDGQVETEPHFWILRVGSFRRRLPR
ncbi:hypothetical protein FOXG_16646 [Fusarium oxysporum f. sp. lycopersici 4287]|uniref:Uncharacterized protein n=2 Tax=Fusarium oxysporum TaxID=5507 RepID=A0A0J9W9R5_FUSO4|nr:hypothetical protein FOXG_16646 [Fusarium oxysporum f. sp. lycopersici 4287]KNB19231.1 hypothetical protein FOXG_16646 [Fusarium oxysporum f. sp. lycopersici 4287]